MFDEIFCNYRNLYSHVHLHQNYKIKDIEVIIKNSSYKSVCRNISIESLIKNDCQKRNIINYNNDYDTFQFTSAINIFLEQAKEIANMYNIQEYKE